MTVLLDLIGFGMIIPQLPFYAQTFHATPAQIGWLFASYSLMQLLFAPPLGRLSDRVGRRPVLLVSITGSIAAYVLFAFAPSFLWLLVSRALARRRSVDEPPSGIGPGRLAALFAGAYATGSYGGYFAASQGVLQIGVFGLLLRESLQRLNALKNVLTLAVNAVAAGAYVVVATDRVDWRAAGLVAAGSLLGGYVGARFGRRLPSAVLRGAIIALGCVAIAVLLTR